LKKQDFDYNLSIYVVGNEQLNHFKQLFKILELLGMQVDCYHLSYGMIELPEGKMKSRAGRVVDADDIVAEMISLAEQEVPLEAVVERQDEVVAEAPGLGDREEVVLHGRPVLRVGCRGRLPLRREQERGAVRLRSVMRTNTPLLSIHGWALRLATWRTLSRSATGFRRISGQRPRSSIRAATFRA
jgi:hypothetical protein